MSNTEMVSLEPPSALSMPIGEAMFTQRAIRRFDPDRPVDDADLETIMDAASKAPTGGNIQPVRMLVVRARDRIEAFGALYHEAWWAKRADELGWEVDQEIPPDSPYAMPALLASEMASAPVVVLVYSRSGPAVSVLPAVQNLMLAARALGIGSVLTTLHPVVLDRVAELFGVPDDATFHCCVPLGHPRGNFGPTRRRPSSATTYWDSWGSAPPW